MGTSCAGVEVSRGALPVTVATVVTNLAGVVASLGWTTAKAANVRVNATAQRPNEIVMTAPAPVASAVLQAS